MIVCIGYGFGDQHINQILRQALQRDEARRLLVILHCKDDEAVAQKKNEIVTDLGVKPEQVCVNKGSAKDFLETPDLHKQLLSMIPKPADAPF